MFTLSQQDFERIVQFVRKNFGIDLSKKKQLIESRLTSTIMSMGLSNFTQYVDHILSTKNQADIEVLLNKLTTNYTYFMREKQHFEYFTNTILPYLTRTKRNKVLSIWSAGCSSGEEPYTLTMLLKDYFGNQSSAWDTRILATDISQNALSIAAKGEYDAESLRDVPAHWKRDYFVPVPGTDRVMVAPKIKSNVIYRTFNLMQPIQFKIPFDVIFCRNVMIYFDQPTKDALVQRFYQATNPGGYLLIGHSESVNRATVPYQYIMPATYRKPL